MAHAKAHDHPIFAYGGDVPEALDVIRKERSHALVLAMVAILVALVATLGIMYLLLAPTHLLVR
ncbi:hypothetical protein LVJ94_11175 [Pendulispora rubella]|uniref:Uncharacterized protein n=1 Tax=Pendulispora rubella TaxID=2741070 RepID=A0ABZ2LA36_9BACT